MKKLMVAVVGVVVAAGSTFAGNVFKCGGGSDKTTGAIAVKSRFESELSASGQLSMGVWVKDLTHPYSNYIIGFGGQTMINIAWTADANHRKLTFYTGCGATVGAAKIKAADVQDGNWHFVFGTIDLVDTKTASVYFDGELVDTQAVTAETFPSGKEYFGIGGQDSIGGSGAGEFHYFNNGTCSGYYAEASVWSRALTATEVADLYTHRLSGNETGLLIYAPMDQANGSPKSFTGGDTYGTSPFSVMQNCSWAGDETFPLPGGRYLVPAGEAVSSGTGYRSWETAATNLQDALDAALFGETIHVKPGHYLFDKEAFVTNKSVRIVSCDPATGTKDRDGTIFDGQGKTRIFYSHCGLMTSGDFPKPTADRPVVIDSITFTNGYAATSSRNGYGGAVNMRAQGSTETTRNVGTLANCLFVGNHAEARGGAVGLWGGFITNCVFRNNTAVSGGGAFCGTQSSTSYNRSGDTDPAKRCGLCTVIQDSLFETNKVTGANCSGGAYLTSSDANQNMYIVGCTFVGNSIPAGGGGGAVGGMYYGCVRDCTFVGNTGGSYGSALRLQSSTFVSNCVFEANGVGGFGVVYNEGAGKMQYCTFRKNAGINLYLNGSRTFENCLFAEGTLGSQVVNFQSSSPIFRNCTFANNTGKVLDMSHADSVKHPSFVNCIFAGNNNGGAQIAVPNGTVNSYAFTNCLTSVAFPVHERIFETDTVVGAPGFVDAANGDFTLKSGAKARDKGIKWMTSATMTDLAGNPRLVNRDGVANAPDALPDIGCYECQEQAPGFLLFMR